MQIFNLALYVAACLVGALKAVDFFDIVRIDGLLEKPELNGLYGVVLDDTDEMADVHVFEPSKFDPGVDISGCFQTVTIPFENLTVLQEKDWLSVDQSYRTIEVMINERSYNVPPGIPDQDFRLMIWATVHFPDISILNGVVIGTWLNQKYHFPLLDRFPDLRVPDRKMSMKEFVVDDFVVSDSKLTRLPPSSTGIILTVDGVAVSVMFIFVDLDRLTSATCVADLVESHSFTDAKKDLWKIPAESMLFSPEEEGSKVTIDCLGKVLELVQKDCGEDLEAVFNNSEFALQVKTIGVYFRTLLGPEALIDTLSRTPRIKPHLERIWGL